MKPCSIDERLPKHIQRALCALIRVAIWVGMLLVAIFIYLRVLGVPAPLLQQLVLRANTAGIPVAMDAVRLTLHGWRADNLRYYSKHPDDLVPVFQSDRMYFVRRHKLTHRGSRGWYLDLKAEKMEVTPSVAWGVNLPNACTRLHVDSLEGSVAFLPDRIEVQHGRLSWNSVRFFMSGTILKGEAPRGGEPVQKERSSLRQEQVQKWEEYLGLLDPDMAARVELVFAVDAGNPSDNRLGFSVEAAEFPVGELSVSQAEVSGSYQSPLLAIQKAAFSMGSGTAQLAGSYDVKSRQLTGSLSNTIRSRSLYQMVSAPLTNRMDRLGLQLDALPELNLTYGPATLSNLLYTVNGSFSLGYLKFRGIEAQDLVGVVASVPELKRFEFRNLSGTTLGRPDLIEEYQSSMRGGELEGAVSWDGASSSLDIQLHGAMDPNLLQLPFDKLDIVKTVIKRFRFKDQPPEVQFGMQACVNNWKTLHLDISGTGKNLFLEDVPFTYLNVSTAYTNRILRLDPVTALQAGGRPSKGSAEIDFGDRTAAFDVVSSLDPASWERIVLGQQLVFGKRLLTSTNAQLSARGIVDWGGMKTTRFSGHLNCDKVIFPGVALADGVSADFSGLGSSIVVSNAVFKLNDGTGSGAFSMDWMPSRKAIPYTFETKVRGVNFQRFSSFTKGGSPVSSTGSMRGQIKLAGDLSQPFFKTAKGQGELEVKRGQLRDLPLFRGFSGVVRKMIPGFSVFSISSLRGTFSIADGAISSDDAYFGGDLISAKGKGLYHHADGFDASIEVQIFNESRLSKVVQVITSPLMKLLEIKLEGPLNDPSWKLNKF